jgi:hypothetical protein
VQAALQTDPCRCDATRPDSPRGQGHRPEPRSRAAATT